MNERDPQSAPPLAPIWERCLDFDSQDAGHYLEYVNQGVLGLVDGAPRRILELGCAGGMFGATLKQRFPGATVVGVEAGRAAAEKAAMRLDRVIHSRLEDLDFSAQGFAPGEFDAVIAADVLEHIVNPWEFLVRLKPWLAPGAQVLASIPNVRNIGLVSRLLLEGRWEYVERGLLDITHMRFFTLVEMRRLFTETGYTVELAQAAVAPGLREIYAKYRGRDIPVMKAGRLTLTDVTAQEIEEFFAEQFLLRCRPA
jgi:2-polyprenyl-3-methyl-5-hydroxy-6-metoxy-1,4-benzoquinol methylase